MARALERRPGHMRLLACVAALDLPDAWIGAGLVRNAVWDDLHGVREPRPLADIDVVYFDPGDLRPEADTAHEIRLRRLAPGAPWSVKNQARMHLRNGDAPYADTADAMRFWPETCTAVAARLRAGALDILAPLGLEDLLALRVRPGPGFAAKPDVFRARLRDKGWLTQWPRLSVEAPD